MWQNFVNAILGLWTIVAAYAYMSSGAGRTIMIITGIVVAILGFWGGSMATSSDRPHGAM